ncbi:MAG: ferritin-like domain-containing protein [Actinobacteria bacterium]|nr:ferritin-like domain-containing protein [Actinomycetota bacterium]
MSVRNLDALPTVTAALQSVLAGENACVYAYGLIGAQLSDAARTLARQFLAEHTASRDRVRQRLIELSVQPEPAAAAYNPPFPITSKSTAQRLGALIEDRLALVWADLVASARAENNDEMTSVAAAAVAACAVRSSRWNGTTQAFPGLLSTKG